MSDFDDTDLLRSKKQFWNDAELTLGRRSRKPLTTFVWGCWSRLAG